MDSLYAYMHILDAYMQGWRTHHVGISLAPVCLEMIKSMRRDAMVSTSGSEAPMSAEAASEERLLLVVVALMAVGYDKGVWILVVALRSAVLVRTAVPS